MIINPSSRLGVDLAEDGRKGKGAGSDQASHSGDGAEFSIFSEKSRSAVAYINGLLSIFGLTKNTAQAAEPMAPREEARFVQMANLLYGCCSWQSAFFRLFSLKILKRLRRDQMRQTC